MLMAMEDGAPVAAPRNSGEGGQALSGRHRMDIITVGTDPSAVVELLRRALLEGQSRLSEEVKLPLRLIATQ